MSEKTVEKEVIYYNCPIEEIRERMKQSGGHLGSVHFHKRKGGELRKMSYKLGVTNPSTGPKPKGNSNRKSVDIKNNQMTVYDVNKVVRDKEGKIVGRGAYRTVPLENVVRIRNNGITYHFRHI